VDDRRHHEAVCSRVAAKLVCDQTPWRTALRLEEAVDHVAVLVDGTSEILLVPLDVHKQFVQVPCFAQASLPAPKDTGVLMVAARCARGSAKRRCLSMRELTTGITTEPSMVPTRRTTIGCLMTFRIARLRVRPGVNENICASFAVRNQISESRNYRTMQMVQTKSCSRVTSRR
jgi:hypothetical protein